MRRQKASKRAHGRAGWILLAACIGYLLGNWHASAVRSAAPGGLATAAQTIALRFPENLSDAPVVEISGNAPDRLPASTTLGDPQLALFAPTPIISRQAAPQVAVQTASAEPTSISPSSPVTAPAKPVQQIVAVKPHSTPRVANRPGYMLDDAQIASIKQRLHLTPDQERMWPAVEVALRNIAFARARDAKQHGVQPGGIDPNSTEVQDLKSAAIPLLMSFSDQQKDEVRSLVHVMGVDQLATQF